MNLNLELMELHMKKQVKDAKKRDADPASIDAEKNMRPMTAVTKSLSQAKELDPDLDRAAGGGAHSKQPRFRCIRGGRPPPRDCGAP